MEEVDSEREVKENELKVVWFQITKKMFKTFPYIDVINLTLKASEERDNVRYKKLNKFIKGKFRTLIDDNIKISQIAKEHGIKIKGKMMICPFHKDKDPSLSFDDSRNIFNCFGCGAKGDIIEFKRRLVEGGIKKRG